MTQTARAAVCRDWNTPIGVETIQVEAPRRNEVMIRLHACGVCHSDLSAATGVIAFPPPLVLGHEGAGEVVALGDGVTDFSIGDRVITSFVSMCGTCRYCNAGRPVLCDTVNTALTTLPDGTVRTRDADGNDLSIFSGCGVMAEYATLHVNNVVPVTDDVPMDRAALVGCAVMTGVGAVFNTAQLEPGSTAVVFGAGGVGLNTIQGCRIAGARQIVAVDMSEEKLETAKRFGATDVVVADDKVHKAVRKLTGGGADYAFECVGRGAVAQQAYNCLGKGGTVIIVGVAPQSDMTSVNTLSLPAQEKGIRGSWFGSARPRYDFPKLFGLYASGQLLLDELVTQTYSIDEAPKAFADMEAGRNARGVIVFD
ncbi:Zn-dependent alcohol dehydrogenase [Aquisalimonas sp.]|uniref:Zn-dependent alcohol dehydrogenase n=1 Tax=unclassified Aquisalimonas TaxID=2644645 RepID=UPI0025B98680|nr:Zn-dependent alcohol dehydrogenase [Aquisalimonas sp.]